MGWHASGGSSGGWKVRWDVDWTQVGTHDFKTTSALTVAGITVTAQNTANATTFSASSTTGLRIEPASATNMTTALSSASAPYLEFAIRDIITGLDERTVWALLAEVNWVAGPSANYHRAMVYVAADDNDLFGMGRYWSSFDKLTARSVRAGAQTILDQAATGQVVYGLKILADGAVCLSGASADFSQVDNLAAATFVSNAQAAILPSSSPWPGTAPKGVLSAMQNGGTGLIVEFRRTRVLELVGG